MVNEGFVVNGTQSRIKSVMIRQLRALERTDPDTWERAVFRSLTRHGREDVDFAVEDNQAGYYTWLRSFDQLVSELVDDGYVRLEETNGQRVLVAVEPEPAIAFPNTSR